jgi:hypothetical protein
MEVMATVRQARLKPESADRYPSLPVRMWTSATWVAAWVASYRHTLCDHRTDERPLSATDFEFRGGSPRDPECLHERTVMSPVLTA